jgi:hypothetical protein
MKSAVTPEALLTTLVGRTTHKGKAATLAGLHEICRVQCETSRDFSLRTMGKLCKAAGLFVQPRMIYNEPSKDYRELISCWKLHCGQPKTPPVPVDQSINDNLHRIDDLALRSLFQATIVERNALRNELNMMKSRETIYVDRRPAQLALVTAAATPATIPPVLLPSEADALREAISMEFFDSEGWKEGAGGEVVNDSGRRVYPAGYTTAIRKVLAAMTMAGPFDP